MDADEAAASVARDAGLVVKELTSPEEFHAAHALLMHVWRTENQPMPVEMMRALSHAGAYVAGAFTNERLVGATIAFLGTQHLHSHITGVDQHVQGRRVGFALKLHQRAWALRRGIDTISWTFDPLVRRNAYFNLAKLGACADEYLVDFYGPMADGINAGQSSDRLLITWSLASRRAVEAAAGRVAEPDVSDVPADAVVLHADDAGVPRISDAPDTSPLLCATPEDIEALRTENPALALEWRHGVRQALGGALSNGYRVAGMTRAGWYVLEGDR